MARQSPKPVANLDTVGTALELFSYIDSNPEMAEATWVEVYREPDEYVIGYYDGWGYRAWEMIYTDLVLPSMAEGIAARHQSAADTPMAAVETERNIGESRCGTMGLHRLRLWQHK